MNGWGAVAVGDLVKHKKFVEKGSQRGGFSKFDFRYFDNLKNLTFEFESKMSKSVKMGKMLIFSKVILLVFLMHLKRKRKDRETWRYGKAMTNN